jgi:hypothetical protein
MGVGRMMGCEELKDQEGEMNLMIWDCVRIEIEREE